MQQIGVGHRGALPAAVVARWPRAGTSALRADLQPADPVHGGDRAAAGADLHHFDDRNPHRQAAALAEPIAAIHFEGTRLLGRAVVDQADLRRGAAHVQRHHPRQTEMFGEARREDGAAGRARFHQPDRKLPRRLQGREAAAGRHHQKRAIDAERREPLLHVRQIARHQRLHVGVGARRGEALELADLRADVARQRDRQFRQRRGKHVAGQQFVARVGVAVQIADGHALDALLRQRRHQRLDRARRQRHKRFSRRVHALGHGQPPASRHQRLRAVDVHVVLLEAVLERHLEHVAVSFGRHQRRARAAPFDDRVGGQGGAVQHHAQVRRGASSLCQNLAHTFQGAGGRRRVGRQNLGADVAAGGFQHHVGEGAADVHRDAIVRHPHVSK